MRRAEDLLDDAQDSLGAAKDLLATRRWAKACFMSQQAMELAVKAALNALGKERRGHDIHRLLFTEKQAREAVATAERILGRMGEIVHGQAGAGS